MECHPGLSSSLIASLSSKKAGQKGLEREIGGSVSSAEEEPPESEIKAGVIAGSTRNDLGATVCVKTD